MGLNPTATYIKQIKVFTLAQVEGGKNNEEDQLLNLNYYTTTFLELKIN